MLLSIIFVHLHVHARPFYAKLSGRERLERGRTLVQLCSPRSEGGTWVAWLGSDSEPPQVVSTVGHTGASICLPILRWVLNAYLFVPLSRAVVVPKQYLNGKIPDKLNMKVTKLTESQWKLFCYGSLVSIGYFSTVSQPWFLQSRQFWADWPNHEITGSMQLLYVCQMAYYVSSTWMLSLWEIPRKDHNAMMLHHCATTVLVALSRMHRYHRSASCIMVLHDFNDVIMEIAKQCQYLGYEAAATVAFAAFMISWATTRLTLYPMVIIRSSLFEVREVLGYAPPAYAMINAGLILLYFINLYWFRLIVRIAWNKLTTGKGKDIREDASDSSE